MRLFTLLFVILSLATFSCKNNNSSTDVIKPPFDWQGHRGARGLAPENTIPSFIKALEFGVLTLECDVVVSADSQLIVSHEPWFNHKICSKPDGSPVVELESEQLLIYKMNYEEIKKYDCGKRGNPSFPDQVKMAAAKPSFMEMVSNVELHVNKNRLDKPFYNVELKSGHPWYEVRVPRPERFVALALKEIEMLEIKSRVTIQSFDLSILQEVRKQDPNISTALLIDNTEPIEINLERLGFKPNIYSPSYTLVNKNAVRNLHSKGIKIIPWTVNDTTTMRGLIDLGVDGIITDYPDLIGLLEGVVVGD